MQVWTPEVLTSVPFVDLKAQYSSIKDEIDAAIQNVISSTAFVGGPYVNAFEQAFARFCGVRACAGVGNGTDALFIALKVLGVGPGDEVITAANSFVATAEAITMTGASVVFADIDPLTYNLSVSRLEEKITEKTKAIIPVHLYGHPADMDRIVELARKWKLRVVNDAAQAHGAHYRGKPIARFGDITCFSFYPGKNLGAYGDGGALVTDHEEWVERARMMANHGRAGKYEHEFEGVNSRLDGLQAAILTAKLKYLGRWTDQRRAHACKYREYLKDLDLITPVEIPEVGAVYHLYVIRVRQEIRSDLQQFLKSLGVNTGIHYPVALPYLNAYRYLGHGPDDFPEALRASEEVLSLPMFAEMTEQQIRYVAQGLAKFGL